MAQERLRKGDVYTNVLNDILRSSTKRWALDERRSQEIGVDTIILNIVLDLARRSGYGFDVKLKDTAVLTGKSLGLTSVAKRFIKQEEGDGYICISTPTGDESWKNHSRRFFWTASRDYLFLNGGSRCESCFQREDVLSIKAVEKK
jgi:hypothetical protein